MPQAKSPRPGERPASEAPPPAWAAKLKAGLQWMASMEARAGQAEPRPAQARSSSGARAAAPPRSWTPGPLPEPEPEPERAAPAPLREVAPPTLESLDIPPIDLAALDFGPPGPPAAAVEPEVLEDGFELIEEEDPSCRPPLRRVAI